MKYLEDLRIYVKVLMPKVWKTIGMIVIVILIIITIKFIISKIPKIINKKNYDWGLTESEERYIMEGKREEP